MTAKPSMVKPTHSVLEAARYMKDINCGVLPVGDPDKVVGMITDRDITIRVTAETKDPKKTLVQDVMTKRVYSCDEDDDIEDAAEKMRKSGVARLLVAKGKKVTGIVNMVELLRNNGDLRKGDEVLHELVGERKKRVMAGCRSCD